MGNPLEVPLEVEVRLASVRNLGTATARENANPFVEHLDAPWEMEVPHQIRHLEPGAKERWPMTLTWKGRPEDAVPAQVEFVVRWAEPGKEVREVVVKRRVGVIPRAEVPVVGTVEVKGEAGWSGAATGELFSWEARAGEAVEREPEWAMVADGARVYMRVRMEGAADEGDALNFVWQAAGKAEVERLRVVPFGEKEVWRSHGVGAAESSPVRGESDEGASVVSERTVAGYTVTVAMPRAWVFGGGKEARVNLSASKNSDRAGAWRRSWAPEGTGEGGAVSWGRLSLKDKP
jgi:hypothetical protein